MEVEYCYSTDEEYFNLTSFSEVLEFYEDICGYTVDSADEDTSIIGCTYWRGEKVELKVEDCIDISGFLEACDNEAYEYIGDIYDNCFQDVSEESIQVLKDLVISWANTHVKMRYWRVVNTAELKITEEDLEG